ncbi:DUF5908 family protein [Kosakonia sp. BYX6]|uniref:DUF5908 family protein n=1 Tax=Kosakonia calanthes TaxID=3139408 RepID=A0ABZ3B5J3_9ENTR
MTIEINELIIEAHITDSPPADTGPRFSPVSGALDEEYLIEKLKQEIVEYLIERELL